MYIPTDAICCFTGHRHIDPRHIVALSKMLNQTLETMIRQGVTVFRTGGALGFDTLAALTVLDMKELHPHIRLELYLPCRDQTARWNPRDRAIYNDILAFADRTVVLHETYVKGCMHERNRAMVDGSYFCLAYCTSDSGGSAYTVRYAQSQSIRVINFGALL